MQTGHALEELCVCVGGCISSGRGGVHLEWAISVKPQPSAPRSHLKGEGAVSRDEDDMLEGQACNAPEVFLPSQVEKAKGYLESG